MKVIVFSGLPNTGKTRAIRELTAEFEQRNIKFIVYKESAIEYIEKIGPENVDKLALQTYVYEEEIRRLNEIKKFKQENKYQVALVDRTLMDCSVFTYWNAINGSIQNTELLSKINELIPLSKEVYDVVIYYYKMFKPDKFSDDYNKPWLKNIFKGTIGSTYEDVLWLLENNEEFKSKKDTFYNILKI